MLPDVAPSWCCGSNFGAAAFRLAGLRLFAGVPGKLFVATCLQVKKVHLLTMDPSHYHTTSRGTQRILAWLQLFL